MKHKPLSREFLLKRGFCCHNLETEFDKAWALNNLQPLEASINYSKRNNYEG